jgi:general secretion pathway protein A
MSRTSSAHLYEEHFGFVDLPFNVTPNPRFAYDNPVYREAFATLRYGIETRKGFIVVTGEVGTGKTTLLRAVMRSVESTVHTAFILNPRLNFNALLRAVLTDLGITASSRDRATLMATLNDYLIEQFKKDHIVAMLIDEAQDLSDELLEDIRLLSNLETDSNRLIQIVLIGQPELEERLNQPRLRQLKQRITLRCRLTPLPSDEVGPYINCRLKTAGYEGKELFEPKAVEKIGLSSQGIPRLINVICDNALLIAYASSKRKVSAEIIEEVARDLRLTAPSRTHQWTGPVVDLQASGGRDGELGMAERQHTKFEEFFPEDGNPPELYPKSRVKRVGIGTLLALLLTTGIGALLYAQQNGGSVSDIVLKGEDYFEQSKIYLSKLSETMRPYLQTTGNYLSDAAVDTGNYFQQNGNYLWQTIRDYWPQGSDYLSGLALEAKSLITKQWENLKRTNLIPMTEDDRASDPLADFPGLQPNDHPAPAAEEPGLITEPSNEADLNENASSIPDSKMIADNSSSKTPATPVEEGTEGGDLKTKMVEPQMGSSGSKALNRESTAKKDQPTFLGNFEVVQDSFLRDKPASDATVTTLPPGTRIRVDGKSGDYLRVRSLNDPELRGYVHREDAFFERIR